MKTTETMETMKTFDAQKARNVLERVGKFLGILIRENLIKDAPFLNEGELENESDLADDVWEVLQMKPRNCDIYDAKMAEKEFIRQTGSKSVRSKSVRWLLAPATSATYATENEK